VPQLLAFLKPDAVLRTNVGVTIMKELSANNDVKILSFEERQVDANLSVKHYAHVADRPFYPWLERYVTACPVYVMLIEVEDGNVVERLRDFLGKTISHLAAEETIRGRFGIYAGVNCVHMSDSLESGEVETALWRKRLAIAEGQFGTDIGAFIKRSDATLPNNTLNLREVCIRIAEEGIANEEQITEIHMLLEQECKGATSEQVERLTATVVGSCLN
jgi:nucleoside-diphosphate kinase